MAGINAVTRFNCRIRNKAIDASATTDNNAKINVHRDNNIAIIQNNLFEVFFTFKEINPNKKLKTDAHKRG
jgi:phage baseplate assembly protein W